MNQAAFLEQLRSIDAQEYWTALERSGWLKDLAQRSQTQLRQRITKAFEEADFMARAHVFYALAVVVVDSECIHMEGPSEGAGEHSYTDVLRLLAKHSGGTFKPRKIRDQLDYDQGRATVAFAHGKQQYQQSLVLSSDWLDRRVLDLVNQALMDADVQRRFIVLPACDQLMYLVFVDERTYHAGIEAGLIPEGDVFDP